MVTSHIISLTYPHHQFESKVEESHHTAPVVNTIRKNFPSNLQKCLPRFSWTNLVNYAVEQQTMILNDGHIVTSYRSTASLLCETYITVPQTIPVLV